MGTKMKIKVTDSLGRKLPDLYILKEKMRDKGIDPLSRVGKSIAKSYRIAFDAGYFSGFAEAMKACGNCKNCYGKGYSTVMRGEESGYTDFGKHEKIVVRGAHRVIVFCKCSRGHSLMKQWPSEQKTKA